MYKYEQGNLPVTRVEVISANVRQPQHLNEDMNAAIEEATKKDEILVGVDYVTANIEIYDYNAILYFAKKDSSK